MQRALYLAPRAALQAPDGDFDRLYYGAEFCEHLLPSPDDLRRARDWAADQGWR